MLTAPKYHFTIGNQSDLLADVDVWEPALPGVFEKGHLHAYYEILVFKKGGGTHQMGAEVFSVADCSIHVLQSNHFHELRRTPETDGFEIVFSDVFLHQLQQFDPKTNYLRYFSQSHVLNLGADQFGALQVYFDELIRNRGNKSIFYNLTSLIILKIITSDVAGGKAGRADLPFEKALLTLLAKHYREKQTLEFYASRLAMSLATFQRHTKAAFGKSIIELQAEKIIREAKFLLSQGEAPIKEISAAFNFTDEAHFNHFFKKHVGLSPSAYRKAAVS